MIVIVSAIVPPEHSGAGVRIFDYYKYIKAQGLESILITHTQVENDNSIISIKKLKSKGQLRKVNMIFTFFKSLFQLAIKFMFLRIKQPAIKTVWIVSCSPLTFAASIVFNLLGYKIIVQNTLTGSDEPGFRYPGDFMSLKYNLKRLQYYLAGKVTCISPALYGLTKNYHPHCVMIPNPVNPKYKAKHIESVEKNKVLFVGALGYRKGADIVFKTMELVHKINPLIKFTFVGPDEMDDTIKRILNEAKHINRDNVCFVGFQKDTAPWFAEADIFFMPSRREGFGIVFIEAMASGIPVVAKELEGITNYIFGEEYPTIIGSEDPQQHADAIFKLLSDNDEYNRLTKLGLERVKRFEKEKIYQEYLAIIKN
jgi:glycosyltransferase involved in cell wall biosynthesis